MTYTRPHRAVRSVLPNALRLVAVLTFATLCARAAAPETIRIDQELRGMDLVRYRVRDHLDMAQGAVELELVLRFAAETQLSLEEVAGSSRHEHTFLTVILDGGNRISVWYSRLRRTIGLVAWDRATRRHLIVESVPADWRQDQAHTIRLSWGNFLTLTVDGETVVSKPWRGLAGPWGQTEPGDAYLLVGSIKMWAHTQSDFLAKRIAFFPPPPELTDVLKAEGELGIRLPETTVTIPRLPQAPVIDGIVDDAEWAAAAAITGLVNVQTMLAMPDPTVFFLGYDAERLYIGIRAFRKDAQLIDAACHTRDGAVYLDDAIEVFLRPDGKGPHYQFIGNSFGTIYDSYDGAVAWDGNWDFKTHHSDSHWSGEVAIAWSELGRSAPVAGESWTLNVCRELPQMTEIASWALIHRSYGQPDRFGKAVFAGDGTAARVLGIEGFESGRIVLHCQASVPARANIALTDGQTVLAEHSEKLGIEPAAIAIAHAESSAAGQYLLTYRFETEEGVVLTAGAVPFALLPPFDVHVRGLPSFDLLDVAVDVRGMPRIPDGAAARASILDADGNVLVSGTQSVPDTEAQFNVRLQTGDLAPGEWQVCGELLDAAGSVLHTKTLVWSKKDRPWWHGSRAGIVEQVLPPWTPMTCTGTTVGCWGREIVFDNGVFPRQIVSQGQQLLASPMRMLVTCGDRILEFREGECRVVASAGHEVKLSGRAAQAGIEVTTAVHAEYDGMFRFDISLGGQGGIRIDGLTIEVPLRAEHSILMHENDGSRGWAGLTGDAPRQMVFTPTIWLGDDDRGLCWFAESAQGWTPSTAGAIEIERKGDTRVLRLNMIREQTTIDTPLRYTFGLMPTPVRPLPAHVRDWRLVTGIGRSSMHNVVLSEHVIYPAARQLDNRQGTIELWLIPAWPLSGPSNAPEPVWQQVLGVEYGPFPGRSHLDLVYGPHKHEFTVSHTAVGTDPKTGQRTRNVSGLLRAPGVELQPGHMVHLALTWGEELTLLLNGDVLAGKPLAGLIPEHTSETLEEQELILGARDRWHGRSAYVFDELRVSSRPRSPAELADARPIRDESTLLLDHFSDSFQPDGEVGRTRPEVCAGDRGGGVPTIGCAFVPATHGTGLRVVVQPPRDWVDIARNDVGLTHALDWGWHKYMGRWDLLLEPDAYRARIDAMHNAGLQYYVYTYKCLPPAHPVHEEYFHEWGVLPRVRWLNPTVQPDARNYDGDSTCSNSPYTDYFVAAYEKTLKEYDLDGIYLDGNTKPVLCTNRNHGCGYRDLAGNWRGTYPVFATREMLKRLYAVTRLNKPQGIVDVHESFCLCIPTSSFCDVIYTGEHEPFNPERIDEVRVRYGHRAWGIPIEVLGSTPNHVFFHQRYWAYMLIHDARVRPAGAQARRDMQRKTAQIRRVLEPFRGPDCTWLPYYRPSPFTSPDRDVYVSAWGRPERDEHLLVVAYFGRTPERIVARVNVELPGRRTAENPLTHQPVPFADGTLSIPIGFEEFRLVRVGPST